MSSFGARLIGNAPAARRLASGEAGGTGAHAYLLTGPEQVGKRTLALAFASMVTCDAPTGAGACGACISCAAGARAAHPDVHIVERREDRRTIVIEQAQEVVRIATIRPYQSQRKVIVIVDAESLEERAANLMLKTIEEPAEDTRLVITAADADRVLPTIRSRCREIALRAVPAAEIAHALVERGVATDEANLVSRLSAGRPGWALSTVADPAILSRRAAHLALLDDILGTTPFARLPLADRLDDARNLARAREVMAIAFATWTGWWRDALVVHAGCPMLVANVDRVNDLARVASHLGAVEIVGAIARIAAAAVHLDDNVSPRLALEGLFLDLPHLARD